MISLLKGLCDTVARNSRGLDLMTQEVLSSPMFLSHAPSVSSPHFHIWKKQNTHTHTRTRSHRREKKRGKKKGEKKRGKKKRGKKKKEVHDDTISFLYIFTMQKGTKLKSYTENTFTRG